VNDPAIKLNRIIQLLYNISYLNISSFFCHLLHVACSIISQRIHH